MDAYRALARRAAAEGVRMTAPDGSMLARWAVGSPRLGSEQAGPEIWAQLDRSGEVLGATPFFSTGMPYRLAVTGIGEDPDEPLEGWIDGWLEPSEEDEPFSGAFPLRVNLVDFALARSKFTTFPTTHRVEIAALAHEADLYANEAAYAALPGEMHRLPVQSFVSTAHFAADEPAVFEEATALASAYITEARLLINPATEASYWWVQFTTQDVTIHAFADREVLAGEPQAGQIISGSFWLVGRTV